MPVAPQPANLAGRDHPLALIQAVLGDARQRRRGMLLVVGEAGVGKTALVRTALTGADATVLWASGDQTERHLPHGVIDQLIRVAPLPPAESEALRESMGPDPLATGSAMVGLVDRLDLNPARPLVVVVDDAQWADEASLSALLFAARRLRRDPAALILTVRSEGVGELPEGLVRLVADEGQRIDLEPLTRADVRTLIEARFGRDLGARPAERLRAHTGGIPIHVMAVLNELTAATLSAEGELPAPRSYSTLVLARLAACPPATEALVVAAAVLGGPSPLGLLATAGGVIDPLAALDDAVRRQLLTVQSDGPGREVVDVSHPLVRSAVVSDLMPGRRVEVHRQAAEALTGPQALRHRLLAHTGEDPELWPTALEVVEHCRVTGQLAVAAHLADLAIGAAPGADEREWMVLEAADLEMQAALLSEAAGRRPLIEGLPASARRSYVLGRLAFVVGPRSDARRLLDDAWRMLVDAAGGVEHLGRVDAVDLRLAGAVAAMQATVAVDHGDGPTGIDRARLALELAPRAAARAATAHLLAGAYALTGEMEEGLAVLDALCESVNSEDPEAQADAHSGRGLLHLWCHDLAAAAADLETSLGAATASFVARETARYYLAEVRYRQGAWDDAILLAETAASLVDDSDQEWMAALPHATAARPLAARGVASGRVHLDQAMAAAAKIGGVSRVLATAAGLEVAASEHDVEAIVAAGDWLSRRATDERLVPWRATFIEGLVVNGSIDRAREVAVTLAANPQTPLVAADLARARAAMAAVTGDETDLRYAEAAAADPAVAAAGVFARARLELALGQARRRHGERRAAAGWLQSARDRFERLAATPWLARTDRELEACGLKPARRRDREGLDLTPTERMVAELVMRGLTNREVAAELVISAKTVEHHLSHIYAKVGVRSRTELAHALRVGTSTADLDQ